MSFDRTENINSKKFNRSYHNWWDRKGEFKMLHKVNPVRCDYILQLINSFFQIKTKTSYKKIRLLDVGCGGGIVSSHFGSLGFNTHGIDTEKLSIESAKHHCSINKIEANFYKATVEEYANLCDGKLYDVILCLEVLEHVNVKEFLFYSLKLLKSGGLIIFSTINKTFKAYMFLILFSEYILNLIPKKTHNYDDFVKPYQIIKIIKELDKNLLLYKMHGLKFDIISQRFYISDNLDTNYFISFSQSNC